MNNKKEYNAKYQTGKEDGFIILDKKEVPVDKLFKTYEKALKYIQKHGEIMDITDSTPLPVLVHEISKDEFWSRRHNRYTVAMFFAYPGCGEGYGAGSMTLIDGEGDKQKYYECLLTNWILRLLNYLASVRKSVSVLIQKKDNKQYLH